MGNGLADDWSLASSIIEAAATARGASSASGAELASVEFDLANNRIALADFNFEPAAALGQAATPTPVAVTERVWLVADDEQAATLSAHGYQVGNTVIVASGDLRSLPPRTMEKILDASEVELAPGLSKDALWQLEVIRQRERMGYAASVAYEPREVNQIWGVRKAGLGLLLGIKGEKKPIAFVEDTAVEPSRLPEFIRGFEDILAGRDTEGSFYAHAGAGCLHIRPLINLKDPAEIRKMDTLAQEICELVLDFGGAMSGEHGDGLARSHFNEKVFGPRVYDAFKRLKAAFDPAGIMNPGKVVDAPAMTDNLRYGRDYRAEELPVVYPYQRHGGFAGAVELCNGAGVCRKELVGTMCPSFMATREEEHSTRGRANLLRALLDGRLPPERESEDRVLEALDLCLGCKACKAECPSGVDMARLKSDFQHHYYRDRRRPLADRIFGAPDVLARWGSRFGPLARWADRRGWAASLLSRTIGFDRRRSLPSLARQPFTRWFRSIEAASQPAAPRGEVALFPDTFTNYFEPQIGIAACRVLWALGYRVVLAPEVCCGRPAISRGLLDRARRLARESVRALGPVAAEGTPIVGLEPSCLFSFRDEIPELVPEEERAAAENVAQRAVLFDEFLASRREELARLTGGRGEGSHALAHGHCHQKTFCGTGPLAGLLGTTGAQVTVADSGCCGMAGSFGYTSDHYEISLAIGERRLFPAVRELATEDALVAAGTSCRHQVFDATRRTAIHPAEYIAQYLADGGGPATDP